MALEMCRIQVCPGCEIWAVSIVSTKGAEAEHDKFVIEKSSKCEVLYDYKMYYLISYQ